MISTILLAKFLGLFLGVMGLGFIVNRAHTKQVVAVLADNAGVQLVATLIPLLLGSFLVVVHNDWTSHGAMLVSFVGWAIFIMGIFRAIFTSWWLARVNAHKENFSAGWVGLVLLIIGLLLLYVGFHGV